MKSKEDSLKYLEKFNIDDFVSPIKEYFNPWQIENELELRQQEKSVKKIIEILLNTDRIFTHGVGRSKLAVLDTGMRLMHLGYLMYEVGHPYQPAMGNDNRYKDTMYAASGSGKTTFVTSVATKAKENGVPIIAITSNANSPLAELATEKIITKGKEIIPNGQPIPPEHEQPINFLQTKSEDKARYIGNMLINYIAKAKGITEDEMRKRHSNVE